MSIQDDLRKILGLRPEQKIPSLSHGDPIDASVGMSEPKDTPAPEPDPCWVGVTPDTELNVGDTVKVIDGVKDEQSGRLLRVILDENSVACEPPAKQGDWNYRLSEFARIKSHIANRRSQRLEDGSSEDYWSLTPHGLQYSAESMTELIDKKHLVIGADKDEKAAHLAALLQQFDTEYSYAPYWILYSQAEGGLTYVPNAGASANLESHLGLPPSIGEDWHYEVDGDGPDWGIFPSHVDMDYDQRIGTAVNSIDRDDTPYPLIGGYVTKGGAGLHALASSYRVYQRETGKPDVLIKTVTQDEFQTITALAVERDNNAIQLTLHQESMTYSASHPVDPEWIPEHLDGAFSIMLQGGGSIVSNADGYEFKLSDSGRIVRMNNNFQITEFKD